MKLSSIVLTSRWCPHTTELMPKRKPQSLDPMMVINAYAQGIFPMADHDGTIHWYAPDPRAILEHENLYVSRSLRAALGKGIYEIRMDTEFEKVMRYCAE